MALELCINRTATLTDISGERIAGRDEAAQTIPGGSDFALVQRCARREPAALRELVRRHQPRVYGFLNRLLGSHEDAEEAVQDVFLRVWQSADRFQGRAAVSTWLYRIAANVAADHLRRRKTRNVTISLDADTPGLTVVGADDLALACLEREARAGQLRQALGTLRPDDRLLMVLYYAEEKDYAEIGAITGHPYPVLKMRLMRARKRLRAALEALAAEESE